MHLLLLFCRHCRGATGGVHQMRMPHLYRLHRAHASVRPAGTSRAVTQR